MTTGERVRMIATLDAMHDDEFTRMSTIGFTSQLTKLDRRFAADTMNWTWRLAVLAAQVKC